MTGGQAGLFEDARAPLQAVAQTEIRRADPHRPRLAVIAASAEELAAHESFLADIDKKSKSRCLWKRLEEAGP
jgi:DNA polymerase-3 subunit epsilon